MEEIGRPDDVGQAAAIAVASTGWCAIAVAAEPTGATRNPLATTDWLEKNLARSDLLVLDASPGSLYKQQHIPGAVSADFFSFGTAVSTTAAVQKRLQSWGLSPGMQVLIYDQGGTYMATRLFWDLVHHGVPASSLLILDGGLAKWRADGRALSKDTPAARATGTVQVTAIDPSIRVRLPEFLAATADPQRHVMLEALEPSYFYGGAAFFNRAGHVPHATLMPAEDFYNADKTFKSPQELQRMLKHLGVKPEQQVLTYCGGGGAAAVPFFALKYLLNYPQVKLFQESQLGWLQDARELPMWTFGDPHLVRDMAWLKAWGSPMLRMFGLSEVTPVDVRAADQFKLGHVPLAVNVPPQALQTAWRDHAAWAALLSQTGLNASHEAVVVSEGGLNKQAALMFLVLENLGQQRVSLFVDSIDRWVDAGNELARPTPTTIPAGPTANKSYTAQARPGVIVSPTGLAPASSGSATPVVYIASGAQAPTTTPPGRLIHLPYTQFLLTDGKPKAAKDIWNVLEKAGVPRYTELLLLPEPGAADAIPVDTLGAAAVNYVVLRLMGFADVKVVAP